MRSVPSTALFAALTLLAPCVARAQSTITIQPILKTGETAGELKSAGTLRAWALDDGGRLLFTTVQSGAGGSQALLLHADGQITPIVARGQEAPGGGTWALATTIRSAMNSRGNIVFGAQVRMEEKLRFGTFFWDAASRKATAVALPGMIASESLPFESSETLTIPQINNRDEIAFEGYVKDATGKTRSSAFLRGPDGRLQPLALLDQAVPGVDVPIQFTGTLTLTDSGAVAFRAQRQGDSASTLGGYLWEQGALSPVALPGGDLPGGAKIRRVTGIWLNNQNRTVLVAALPDNTTNQYGLYRLVEGRLIAVATPGQEMPGGGTLRTLAHDNIGARGGANALGDVSPANTAGQHVFRAVLEDGSRALYRADPDGKMSLVIKHGQSTDLGPLNFVAGAALRLNSRGQVAITARFATAGPETLVVLTPAGP